MNIIPLLTALTVIKLYRNQAEANETHLNESIDEPQCGPNYFSESGGPCQRCSECIERVVASACTPTNDTACGSLCAPGYFESGGRCLKCSLEPSNPSCSTKDSNTTPRQESVAITEPSSLFNAEVTSLVTPPPAMGPPVIYIALGLTVVLLGLLALLGCVVFCHKDRKAARRNGGEDNAGNDDREREPNLDEPLLNPTDQQQNNPPPVQPRDEIQPADPPVNVNSLPPPAEHTRNDRPVQAGSIAEPSLAAAAPSEQTPGQPSIFFNEVRQVILNFRGTGAATAAMDFQPPDSQTEPTNPPHVDIPFQRDADDSSPGDSITILNQNYDHSDTSYDLDQQPAQPLRSD